MEESGGAAGELEGTGGRQRARRTRAWYVGLASKQNGTSWRRKGEASGWGSGSLQQSRRARQLGRRKTNSRNQAREHAAYEHVREKNGERSLSHLRASKRAKDGGEKERGKEAVSYTHLTLPTILLV
eukprot:4188225-Pleurochrysis_carterae.AAC.2